MAHVNYDLITVMEKGLKIFLSPKTGAAFWITKKVMNPMVCKYVVNMESELILNMSGGSKGGAIA